MRGCIGNAVCEAAIVENLREGVPSFLAMWCPGDPVVRLVVDQSSCSWGIHGGEVEIYNLIELCVGI